jgi:gamma-glutamyltranspeptidase/glutathione hydrolase
MQAQGHVQVLVNMIDFGMNVQAAGDTARTMHNGSATPTGLAAEGGGDVTVETEVSDEAIAKLRAMGHKITRTLRSGTYGGYQGILIDWEHGVLHGATESRKDGVAAGY